jgi:hypothetical protein
MLPRFLAELKARGYRIVQIEAGPGHGPTEAAPAGWRSETERTLGSLKPRLEGGPTRTGASFAVKPAPQE